MGAWSAVLTASRTSPGRAAARTAAAGIGRIQAHCGKGTCTHDDGVGELDRDVTPVGRPLRCHTPQGRPGCEPPGQRERGHRQVRRRTLPGSGRDRRLHESHHALPGVGWDVARNRSLPEGQATVVGGTTRCVRTWRPRSVQGAAGQV